jgi:hypothetical protein
MQKTIILIVTAASLMAAAHKTFTGTITDSMCGKDHAAMKMGTDAKCAVACVKAGAKFALYDGKTTYTLSDQAAPEKFAGQRVTVTGTLADKGGVIHVTKIETAK